MVDRLATTRGPSHEADSPGGGWMVVVVGSGDLRAYPLARALVIGRDPACEIALDHHAISRRHARFALGADGACTVEDLGSRNGTQAAGGTITAGEAHPLRAGEPVGIGPFTVVAVREAADRAPASALLEIEDPAAHTPAALLASIAQRATNVLIRGESGVGKQVLAETVHRLSGRPGRLMSINCAAIGGALLESELFGHEKGAFTGAVAAKPGLLEVAGEGTVLLDEIGDMPIALQAKLLRAVESREVLRVGGTAPVAIGARFVSATHRDLLGAVEGGGFRLDLYYRLAGVTLVVPALRERRARIVQLARELLAVAAARDGRPAPALAPAAAARLTAYDWPGNVRELRNVLDRALLFAAEAGPIEAAHLVFDEPTAAAPAPGAMPAALASQTAEEELERRRILDALARCNGNQTRAAKLLGMARSTLVTKLSIYRIERPRK